MTDPIGTGRWRCALCGAHWQRARDPALALELHMLAHHPRPEGDR